MRAAAVGIFALPALLLAGCGRPNATNISLRKEIQNLQEQLETLRRDSAGQARVIEGLRQKSGTLQTLSAERLARLYTVHDLKFGRLTGGADIDPARPGDEGLKLQVTPLDATGDSLKAAGSFEIEAFDNSRPQSASVGKWSISLEESKNAWRNVLTQYNYNFTLPWQVPPTGNTLHVEVTFVEELTQTPIKKTIDIHLTPPPAPPGTRPSE